MGGIPTRYGTAGNLLNLIEIAHRFGIRIYFDNVMAHNGGPIPGYDENTPTTVQPGFAPEDFHLLRRPDGTFRKSHNSDDVNYDDEWQLLNRNQFAIDIAQENPNTSFGANENDDFPKFHGLREPTGTAYYPDTNLTVGVNGMGGSVHPFADKEPFEDIGYGPSHIGAGNGNFDWDDANGDGQHTAGETSESFTDTGVDPSNPARQTTAWGYGDGIYNMGDARDDEDVNTLLFRAVRWFIDQTKADGFRLDAVKHVPFYYFGQNDNVPGQPKDSSNWGYCGQIQEQFNITRATQTGVITATRCSAISRAATMR
jgi:glycosidase